MSMHAGPKVHSAIHFELATFAIVQGIFGGFHRNKQPNNIAKLIATEKDHTIQGLLYLYYYTILYFKDILFYYKDILLYSIISHVYSIYGKIHHILF